MNGQEEQAAELQRYLYALYHAPTTSSREQANDWLNSWQLSRAAWGLVHDILLGRVRGGIVLLQCRLVVVLLHRRGMRHLDDAVTQSATRPLCNHTSRCNPTCCRRLAGSNLAYAAFFGGGSVLFCGADVADENNAGF